MFVCLSLYAHTMLKGMNVAWRKHLRFTVNNTVCRYFATSRDLLFTSEASDFTSLHDKVIHFSVNSNHILSLQLIERQQHLPGVNREVINFNPGKCLWGEKWIEFCSLLAAEALVSKVSYIHVYTYICMCMHIYVYIYTHIYLFIYLFSPIEYLRSQKLKVHIQEACQWSNDITDKDEW